MNNYFTKNHDALLPEVINIFPDKSYREVQKKFAKEGTVDATVAAYLYLDFCIAIDTG